MLQNSDMIILIYWADMLGDIVTCKEIKIICKYVTMLNVVCVCVCVCVDGNP